MSADNAPRPAATVLVLRDGDDWPEVFMVRRHASTGAFRGAHVFPGGRVDAGDSADASWCDGVDRAAAQMADLPPGEALAFHVAAARELFEEVGVLLARDRSGCVVSLAGADDHERFNGYRHDVHAHRRAFRDIVEAEGLRLALDELTPYAHWVTPAVESRRFDTRFFVTRVPPLQTPAHDETETTGSDWTTARAALAASLRRGILLPPPTWITLREIEGFRAVNDIIAWAKTREIRRREPVFRRQNGTSMLVMPDDGTCFVWTDGYWRPEGARGER